MNSIIEKDTQALNPKYVLKATDRCDSCAAEALVQVTGISGDLMFCGHHYNKIMNDVNSYKKMMSFAITIIDEREKLAV
jgi:hypothetical protein